MKRITIISLFLLFTIGYPICGNAQPNNTLPQKSVANNKELVGAVVASISDVAWIKGHWKGEAFGGQAEEIWSGPAGGAMMGMFRLINGEEISFYELMVIREHNQSLILQLKHFHNDMKGWEEKNETVDFPLLKIEENKIWFDGLTFEKVDKNKMIVNVVIDEDHSEGIDFNYSRSE